MMASGKLASEGLARMLRTMRSSCEFGYRLYVPGRSIRLAVVVLDSCRLPVFLSTVTPGKLPVFCLNPVNWLKREDFPVLGFPTSAKVNDINLFGSGWSGVGQLIIYYHFYVFCFFFSYCDGLFSYFKVKSTF
jgi:hypothetical protein